MSLPDVEADDVGAEVGHRAAAPAVTRAYPHRQPANWWLRNRNYFLYMVREFTAIPIALWAIWFLIEIARLGQGAAGYQPFGGPAFAVFSIVCLAFALWHSYTFLNLAGLIMRIPMGDRDVPARVVTAGAFAGFAVISAVIVALVIWGGM